MANRHDLSRNQWMLTGPLREKGYDWWWHSLTGYHERTGEAKSFFIEFFTCNPALGGPDPIFGQDGKGRKPSYLMVKCGTWGEDAVQLHRFFGWRQVVIERGVPFFVHGVAGDEKKEDTGLFCENPYDHTDCMLGETYTEGAVAVNGPDARIHPEWMCGSGRMRWKLKIRKRDAFNVGYGAGSFFRKLNAFEMYWHAEGMKTQYKGWVEWNGEKYLVRPEDCYGYADKNWGEDFTSPWVWLSSNHIVSNKTGRELKNTVFDIGGGRPKVFGIPLHRKLLSDFWYEGRDYEFNFSKFWTLCRTKFDCRETDTQIIWHVEQQTRTAKMIADITCEKKDMLLVNYEAPNGKKLHKRLWNGGTGEGRIRLYRKRAGKCILVDDMTVMNVGCEYGEYGR